jgi:hypothetical protein
MTVRRKTSVLMAVIGLVLSFVPSNGWSYLVIDMTMPQPPMPKGKEHLVYRDFPKMSLHIWEWTLKNLQGYELEVLTSATYKGRDGAMLGRGQIFVHLDGIKNLRVALERDRDTLFPQMDGAT